MGRKTMKLRKKATGGSLVRSIPPIDEFGFGGWLQENAGTVGSVAGGILGGVVAGPAGVAIGSQLGSAVGGQFQEDEIANPYMVPTSLSKQHYQRAARGGKLTRYTGDTHEGGGIKLGGLGVEVEDGETRSKDTIHSDRNTVTKDIQRRYPGVIKKSDIGKTMADVSKRVSKKFERRKWDELNDNAAEVALLPIEQLSEELAPMPEEDIMAYGGDITASKARKILSHGRIRGKAITPKQMRFFGAKSNKAAGGGGLESLMPYAPLITSGIDMFSAMAQGPEEVDYDRVGYSPTNVTTRSADPGIQRVRQTYGNASNKIRKLNPSRYLARSAGLAAGEADAITSVAGQVAGENTRAINRGAELDSMNANRANLTNANIGIQEAQANAANRAANKSRISANLANIGTMSGQISRDSKLMGEQSRRNSILENHLRELRELRTGVPRESTTEALSFNDFSIDETPYLETPEIGLNTGNETPFGFDDPLQPESFANQNRLQYRPSFKAGGGSIAHRLRMRKPLTR